MTGINMGLNVETCVFHYGSMKLSFFEVDVKPVEHHSKIFHGHLPRVYRLHGSYWHWVVSNLQVLSLPAARALRPIRLHLCSIRVSLKFI